MGSARACFFARADRLDPLKLSDFDFDLPPDLIAQEPLPARGASRLLDARPADRRGRRSPLCRSARPAASGRSARRQRHTRLCGAAARPAASRRRRRRVSARPPPTRNGWWWGQSAAPTDGDSPTRGDVGGAGASGAAPQGGIAARVRRRLARHPRRGARSPLPRPPRRSAVDRPRNRRRGRSMRIGHVPLPPYIKRPDAADDRERYQTMFAQRARIDRGAHGRAALHAGTAR